ncbi:hypothetical protein BDW74DRAFT_171966 [Aspergillus multicolor]|uniref:uncharacterized protein n=1 Tax=Aspergillus multicolor TaxID=41759 RepID=UPI003CCD5D3C
MSPLLTSPKGQSQSQSQGQGQSKLNNVLSNIAKQCKTTPDQVADVYPCTPLQQGLITLSVTSPGSYTAQHIFKLQASVDQSRMKDAWTTVFSQHAILRTRIITVGENAMQVVLKQGPQWADCSDLQAYLAADAAIPLQLGETLSRLAISDTHVVWSAHHSVYDGFSVELVLRDVAAVYGGGDILARPSYRQFIQRTYTAKQKALTEAFWKEKSVHVEDVDVFPRLPAAYRPQPNSVYEHEVVLSIDGPSSVTLSTIANAAWALVQASHLGAEEVTFGTTLSGRNANMPDIDKVVGPTLATVPVLLSTNRNQSISEFLKSTQTYFTAIIPHQQIGLQNLKRLSPQTAALCNFQTLFAFQPGGGMAETQTPYAHLFATENKDKVDAAFFNYALTFQCSLAGSGELRVMASYDDNVLSRAQMERLVLQFEHVVSQLLSSNDLDRLSEIQLVSPQDLAQLDIWDKEAERYEELLPLDAIHRHVVSRPNAMAVASWDGTLIYAELDDLATRLACWLVQTQNVGPETVVPICFHRSQWMIVSILAVLKAGGAFLLLDPIYPESRLAYMIEMVQARTILVSESTKDKFINFSGNILAVDAAWFSSHTNTSLPIKMQSLSPDRAMYLVFTSGSTGQPKGVIVTHASYASSAAGHIPALGITASTRQLFFASPAFDLSIYETVSSLMAGATICVPSEEDRNGSVAPVIRNMDVTLISLTSSYARHLKPEDVPGLQTLALVGEPLARDVQRVWADKVTLLNAYGPAECSVVSTVKRPVTRDSTPANIGHTVAGRAWVVHPADHDILLPIGATGELLIEGNHLARGYLTDDDKTAAAYIYNPHWSGLSGRRFYKTGDLVHFDLDGSLIFEGRKDTQVKIRGQRVEVAEVEFHVSKLFPKAAGVAVEVLKAESEHNVQLVAFLFCDELTWDSDAERILQRLSDGKIGTMSHIKQRLETVMPYHMVPTRYQLWPAMPTSLAGKLDRKALKEELRTPSGKVLELDETSATFPAIEATNTVALRLNKKILSLAPEQKTSALEGRDFPLSILGLDSIQLISIVTFIRTEYGAKMTVGTLYDLKLTITGLAAMITTPENGTASTHAPLNLSKELQNVYADLTRRSESAKVKRRVFLTGATGLLGTQILRQLLLDPSVQRVIVHVRATSAEKGLERVVASAKLAKWWDPSYGSRLECWAGDLGLPQLGLTAEQWRMLCGQSEARDSITAIIHNGAAVQWQAPYHALKAVNVDSTVDLLSAVSQWRADEAGSFTFVSGGLKRSPGQSLDSFLKALEQANGYSQSKFVAEELVSRFAREQSKHRISIVRPGWIVGNEVDAVPNTDDFLWKLVQACLAIGAYPDTGGEMWLAVADAEEVATRILGAAFSTTSTGASLAGAAGAAGAIVENVESGTTVSRFWEVIQQHANMPLKAMDAEGWKKAAEEFVARQSSTAKQAAFLPVLAMLQDPSMEFGVQPPALSKTDGGSSGSKRVDGALGSNVRVLVEAGFFKSSDVSSGSGSGGKVVNVFSRTRVNEGRAGVVV